MPREPTSKYFWPASAITESDMALLYRARESSPVRIPITRLIAQAIRRQYAHMADTTIEMPQPQTERLAA